MRVAVVAVIVSKKNQSLGGAFLHGYGFSGISR